MGCTYFPLIKFFLICIQIALVEFVLELFRYCFTRNGNTWKWKVCVLEALGVIPTFHFQVLPFPNFAILQSNQEIFAILLSGIGQVLLEYSYLRN